MKNFIITSKVQSIKTLQYNVKAESLVEAIKKIQNGEGFVEEIHETIDYNTEHDFRGWIDSDE